MSASSIDLRGALRRSVSARSVLAGIALSSAVGIGVAAGPKVAGLTVAGLLVAAIASRAPAVVLACALALLGYSPEGLAPGGGLLTHPELQKGAVYAALLAFVLARGVRPQFILPVVAYIVSAVLSLLHGQLTPGLSLSQVGSTFLTLTLGWTALSIKWQAARDLSFLKVVAFLPLISLALGVVFQGLGLHSLIEHGDSFDAVSRLRGASISAQLALMSFVSAIAAQVCWRLAAWRLGPPLLVVNAIVLGLTLTRGAAIAFAVAMLWPAARFALDAVRARPRMGALRLATLGLVLGGVILLLVPKLEARNAGGRYYPGQGTISDRSSGREKAWKEFYAIANQSPLYGHGLGSGPITKIQQEGFKAQHNEYLRLFLEGGYVGGGLVLLSIVIVVVAAIARAPRGVRPDLASAALGLALLSVTDNTLTSIPLTVPFGLLLGICASWRRPPRVSPVGTPIASPRQHAMAYAHRD